MFLQFHDSKNMWTKFRFLAPCVQADWIVCQYRENLIECGQCYSIWPLTSAFGQPFFHDKPIILVDSGHFFKAQSSLAKAFMILSKDLMSPHLVALVSWPTPALKGLSIYRSVLVFLLRQNGIFLSFVKKTFYISLYTLWGHFALISSTYRGVRNSSRIALQNNFKAKFLEGHISETCQWICMLCGSF